jgi:hypothetical protein
MTHTNLGWVQHDPQHAAIFGDVVGIGDVEAFFTRDL